MGNRLCMGRSDDTLDSAQLCCMGKEPVVHSPGTGELGCLTLEDNRVGELGWDLEISTRFLT